jgi:acyl dehydratase
MSNTQITYQDVHVDIALQPLEIGPWTVEHIVRWCAAQENWERQHTDYKYATEHDGLPDTIANGNWRKYVVARLFKDWAGHGGWLWKLFMRYTGMHFPNDTFSVWANVTDKYVADGIGFVELKGGMCNQEGKETTPTAAIVALPLKVGEDVPYPFVPPPDLQRESPFQKGRTVEVPKYVTDEVKSYIGRETEELESWDESTKTELRRFSQAIPDPDPLYWDEAYAKQTRFKGMVAPPLFPVDAFKPAPDMPDRLTEMMRQDPNFWGGPPGDPRMTDIHIPLNTPVGSGLNGGQEFEIFQLVRLGEKLRTKGRVRDIYEKESKTFGRIVISERERTFWNSKGEIILRMVGRGIHR